MHSRAVRVTGTPAPLAVVPVSRCTGLLAYAGWLADRAAEALTAELDTWPKPGLVSAVDTGSHDDMDYGTFTRSIAAIRPFFSELTLAGAQGAAMDDLRRIGVAAEQAMLAATGGVNTHRGAIFALGLLCAAAGAVSAEDDQTSFALSLDAEQLTRLVSRLWGEAIRKGPIALTSHGSDALRRFGAPGAREEAANGFPHAVTIGLPALRAGRTLCGNEEAARVQAFFALLAKMEDTNLLHRGGAEGLRDARHAARRFLDAGGVGRERWLDRAIAIHRDFVARRLSPGGSADLLAVTIFLDRVTIAP